MHRGCPSAGAAADAPLAARAVEFAVRRRKLPSCARKSGSTLGQLQASSPVSCRPAVVVARLAAHVDHAVDARAAAQHLAARIEQVAAVEAGFRLGAVAPVGARVADAVQVADRDVDPVVVVVAAGLDQQHAARAIGGQAIGEQAAGGAGADDDVVESRVLQSAPSYSHGPTGGLTTSLAGFRAGDVVQHRLLDWWVGWGSNPRPPP